MRLYLHGLCCLYKFMHEFRIFNAHILINLLSILLNMPASPHYWRIFLVRVARISAYKYLVVQLEYLFVFEMWKVIYLVQSCFELHPKCKHIFQNFRLKWWDTWLNMRGYIICLARTHVKFHTHTLKYCD